LHSSADAAGDALGDGLCVTPIRIQLRVIDCEVGPRDPSGEAELAYQIGKLIEVESRASRRIHRGHYPLIEHVEVDVMNPRRVIMMRTLKPVKSITLVI